MKSHEGNLVAFVMERKIYIEARNQEFVLFRGYVIISQNIYVCTI